MSTMYHDQKVTAAILPSNGVAATSDIEGVTLDMAGYAGVMAVVTFGAITGSAVTSIKMQQGAASNMSDAADLEGTGQTIADDDDDETFVIDLKQPTDRYVRLYVDRGTQNAVVASATYIQYGARSKPVSHASGVTGEFHGGPDEGTA